jgi:hypothetical protein
MDHLEEENVEDKLFDLLCDDLKSFSDHVPKDEINENSILPKHLLAQNTNVGSDLDGDFEDDIIEEFLESIDKESIPI